MQRARFSNLYTAAALAVVAAGSGACGGSAATEPASPAPKAPEPAAEAPAPEVIESPIELVPADAFLLVAGDSPARIADAIGWEALRDLEPVARAADAVTEAIGHDILALSGLEALGIATREPFGAAVVAGDREAALIFAKLSSAEAFTEELENIAHRQERDLERDDRGAAAVLVFASEREAPAGARDYRTRFVVRGDHLLIVEGSELTEKVAAARPATSLAETAAYRRAFEALGPRHDAFGFVDVAQFLEDQLAGPYGPPPALGLILDQIGFAGIGFAADLGGEQVGLRLALPAREGGPAPILADGDGVPAIVRGLHRPPLLLANLNLDVDAALARVQQAAGAAALAEAKNLAGQAFAIDIDEEIVPLLTGEVGFALAGDLEAMYAGGARSPVDALDVHLTLGVGDTEVAADLVRRIADSPLVETMVERTEGGGVVIPIPMWKALHIDARAGAVAATTDPGLLGRLGGDAGDSFAAATEPGDSGELLLGDASAIVWSRAIEAGMAMVLGLMGDAGGPALGEPPRGPDTEAYRRQARELAEIEAKLEEAIEHTREARADLTAAAGDFGPLALSLHAEPELVRAAGGHYFTPGNTLASLLARTIDASSELAERQSERVQLSSQRRHALRQLDRLRADE